MAWSTPKIDWTADDEYNIGDINRWKDNLEYTHDLGESLLGITITEESYYADKSYSSYPYASEMNVIENNLEYINLATYNFDIGATQSYSPNGYTVDYVEINRIESATLLIKNTLQSQQDALPKLAFTLGGANYFNVGR